MSAVLVGDADFALVFTPTGHVAHILPPNDSELSLCGLLSRRWRGVRGEADRSFAHSLPRCRQCLARMPEDRKDSLR